jgi:hypothetical protein
LLRDLTASKYENGLYRKSDYVNKEREGNDIGVRSKYQLNKPSELWKENCRREINSS